jgi:decaprenylphospho-beta-D-ribofuranose 2-oxidase
LTPPENSRRIFTGWGRTTPSSAEVIRPSSPEEVCQVVEGQSGPILARGLGRSYGDAAQVAGGLILDMTGLDHLVDLSTSGRPSIGAQAGACLNQVMERMVPKGYFVPVTPGTRQVTVGGAIAADIHGKNHHVDGSFGNHVRSLVLSTPNGPMRLAPESHPEEFWATVGGMGLTGVILEAEFDLIPIESAYMTVDTERTSDLEQLLAAMSARDHEYRYSVAWVDCLARGRNLGRGVLTRGDHAPRAALSQDAAKAPLAISYRPLAGVPDLFPSGLLNRLSISAFNELWYRKAPKLRTGEIQPLTSFFHPLDGVTGWNRLYGRRGFIQYQFVVPFGEERALERAFELIAHSGCPSFLAVLKRFGPANPAPLSFPSPGWTLALDIPVGQDTLGPLCRRLDRLVAAAGGRIYLAKDSRLPADQFPLGYPRLAEWQAIRNRLDPTGLFDSDQARRLLLVPI